jgi:iron complex outermembrane receptor protein
MRIISILQRLPLLGFATLAFTCGSSVVNAQEGADQSTGGLEEIIVSARRRSESLQDVPVAVQAFSAQQIENAGIKNFEEIVARTPGMVFSQSNGLDHEIFIRGIGSDIQGAGADNAIGIFVDGVYMSRNSGSQLGLYDLERVEVLKGPQSLRFGKNIVGGLIHYVTKKPTDEFEGSLEISYGDYDQVDVSAAARGPVSDRVGYALTAISNVHSGYAENTRGEDAEDQNRSAVRGHLQIDATDNTVVLLSADYNRNRSTGRWRDVAVANDSEAVTFNGFFADPIPGLPGFVLPDRSAPWQNSDRRSGPKNLVGNNDYDVYGGSARIEWSGSNGLSLTSITAYREADIASLDESCGVFWDHPFATREAGLSVPDPSAAILAGDVFNYLATVPDCWFEQMKTDDTKQISQELRLSGGNDGAMSWSAGLYYLDEDISRSEIVAFSFPDFSVITEFAGCTFGGSIDFCGPPSGLVETEGVSRATTLSDAQNFGAFGEITYDLSDTVSLNVGVRWVSDDKDFTVTRS